MGKSLYHIQTLRNCQKTHSLVPKKKHRLQHVTGNKYVKCEFKHAFTLHRQRIVFVIFSLRTNLMRVDMFADLSVYGETLLRPLYLEAIADKTRHD